MADLPEAFVQTRDGLNGSLNDEGYYAPGGSLTMRNTSDGFIITYRTNNGNEFVQEYIALGVGRGR